MAAPFDYLTLSLAPGKYYYRFYLYRVIIYNELVPRSVFEIGILLKDPRVAPHNSQTVKFLNGLRTGSGIPQLNGSPYFRRKIKRPQSNRCYQKLRIAEINDKYWQTSMHLFLRTSVQIYLLYSLISNTHLAMLT